MEVLELGKASWFREFPDIFNVFLKGQVRCTPRRGVPATCSKLIMINEHLAFRIKFLWNGDKCQYFLQFTKTTPNDPLVYEVRHRFIYTGEERYLKMHKCKREAIANGNWTPFHDSLDLISLYCFSFMITLQPAPKVYFVSRHLDINTDLVLRGSDGLVHMHRAVFRYHSDLFKKLGINCPGDIELEDFTVSTLRYLKEFFYLDKLEWLDIKDLKNMILFAYSYKMYDLETYCIYQMTKHVKAQNEREYLRFAVDNRLTRLLAALLNTSPFLRD